MSKEIKDRVQKQCAWILENCSKLPFDHYELEFLSGRDRSTDATGQLRYLNGIIVRHFIVMPMELTDYVPPTLEGMSWDDVLQAAKEGFYLDARIHNMAVQARHPKKAPEPLMHWVNDDGRSLLLSKADIFEWLVREYLSPQNINKIINGTRNVEKGWRLVRD